MTEPMDVAAPKPLAERIRDVADWLARNAMCYWGSPELRAIADELEKQADRMRGPKCEHSWGYEDYADALAARKPTQKSPYRQPPPRPLSGPLSSPSPRKDEGAAG